MILNIIADSYINPPVSLSLALHCIRNLQMDHWHGTLSATPPRMNTYLQSELRRNCATTSTCYTTHRSATADELTPTIAAPALMLGTRAVATGSAADTGCPATAGENHSLHSLHEVFGRHRWNLLAAGSSAVCLITSAASNTLAMIAHAESGGMPQIKHE